MTLSKKHRTQLESFDEESVVAILEEFDASQGQLDAAHEEITAAHKKIADLEAQLKAAKNVPPPPPPPPPKPAEPDAKFFDAAARTAWEMQVGKGMADWDSTDYEKVVWREQLTKNMKEGIESHLNPPKQESKETT